MKRRLQHDLRGIKRPRSRVIISVVVSLIITSLSINYRSSLERYLKDPWGYKAERLSMNERLRRLEQQADYQNQLAAPEQAILQDSVMNAMEMGYDTIDLSMFEAAQLDENSVPPKWEDTEPEENELSNVKSSFINEKNYELKSSLAFNSMIRLSAFLLIFSLVWSIVYFMFYVLIASVYDFVSSPFFQTI
ncbi:MAG: hypothetical protein EYC69_08385 [Bacteroidetes bacterium]|nr:MAG: hypothetical protein EYC69_08385 [Bacteroidota bacterium]